MAKARRWIQGAIKNPGAFTAKANKANMPVQQYALKATAPGSKVSTTTRRQANLALTLGKINKKIK